MQAEFRRKISFNNHPQKRQIYCRVPKFQATGRVNIITKKIENHRSGRKLITRFPDIADAVRDSVGRSSKKSLRKRSQELSLPRASFQRIIKKNLHLYLYRIKIKHKLTPADMKTNKSIILILSALRIFFHHWNILVESFFTIITLFCHDYQEKIQEEKSMPFNIL